MADLINDMIEKIADKFAEKMKKLESVERQTQVFIDFDNLIINNPSSNNYSYVEMTIPSLQEYKYVSVQSCVIPKNYYLIEVEYATMIIKDGVNSYNIAVPTGNYNYITLKTQMLELLNALPLGVWTMDYDKKKSTYIFYNSTPGLYFAFNSNSSLARCLGFDLYETHYFTGGQLESDHPLFLQRTNSVIVRSNITDSKISSGVSSDIFLNIPDTSPVNSPIWYVNNDILATRQPISAIGNTFYLKLVDDSDHDLNPNAGSNINLILFK